jgi:Leucine-rich repeat (LRR) protein
MLKLTETFLVAGQIDPTAFRGLTNLVELDLSGNLLTSVPTPTFSGTEHLLTNRARQLLPAARKYGHITKAVANFFISDWFKGG